MMHTLVCYTSPRFAEQSEIMIPDESSPSCKHGDYVRLKSEHRNRLK